MSVPPEVPKYLPLPQPTSIKTDPGSKAETKLAMFGQALCRVSLKCGAMFSYTCRCKNRKLAARDTAIAQEQRIRHTSCTNFSSTIGPEVSTSADSFFFSQLVALPLWESQYSVKLHSHGRFLILRKVKDIRLERRHDSSLSGRLSVVLGDILKNQI